MVDIARRTPFLPMRADPITPPRQSTFLSPTPPTSSQVEEKGLTGSLPPRSILSKSEESGDPCWLLCGGRSSWVEKRGTTTKTTVEGERRGQSSRGGLEVGSPGMVSAVHYLVVVVEGKMW